MNIYDKISTIKDVDTLETLRQSLNEACDNRLKLIKIYNRANELGDKSFGFIKESIESLSSQLFEKKDGRKLMVKYSNTIKGSKNLKEMHNLFESVRKMHSGNDIDFFVNNIANNDWNVSKKTLSEDVKKLGKILSEAYLLIGPECEEQLPQKELSLYSALEYIAENKKTNKNLAEYSDAVKVIREYIESMEKKNTKFVNEVNLTDFVHNIAESFNVKYENLLTEEEKGIIKEYSKNMNNGQDIFNKYKENCEKRLSEAKEKYTNEGDSDSVKKLETIHEQIAKKEYNKETFVNDVTNLMELTKVFD